MRTTINESCMSMGIFSHPFRLPRKGRGTGDYYNIYCGSGAFTVNFSKKSRHMGDFLPCQAVAASAVSLTAFL